MTTATTGSHGIDSLVAALRTELQEFGGLLRVLAEEHDALLSGLILVTNAVALQSAVSDAAAVRRKSLMLHPDGSRATEGEIISNSPVEYRPLLAALFSEVGALAVRAKELEVQNVWLRKRIDGVENPDVDPAG